MVIFKKRLRDRRISLGYTQEQLGNGVFLSKGEICAYEKGKRIPPLDALIRLANFLEVDFLWLIGMELSTKSGLDKIINLSSDDINIINALKKDSDLYERFLENPERVISQINSVLKKN